MRDTFKATQEARKSERINKGLEEENKESDDE